MKRARVDLKTIAAPVAEHLVPILDEALNACAERHQIGLGRGADNFSFGTDAWSLPARLFRDRVEEGSIPFAITGEPGCVLVHDGIRLRHHRVGWSENDDIMVSFPRNAQAIGRETTKQMSFSFAPDVDSGTRENVVVAYMANPEDGLCAVYLTTVGRVEDGLIQEWESAELVWMRDTIETASAPTSEVVPPEESPTPVVRRGARRAKDAAER